LEIGSKPTAGRGAVDEGAGGTARAAQEEPSLETLDYAGHCIQAKMIGGDYYDFLVGIPQSSKSDAIHW
jgi:hypothetical protein